MLGQAGRVKAIVTLPTFTANQRIIRPCRPGLRRQPGGDVHLLRLREPVYATAPVGTSCDSLVKMPVGASGGSGGQAASPDAGERPRHGPAVEPAAEPSVSAVTDVLAGAAGRVGQAEPGSGSVRGLPEHGSALPERRPRVFSGAVTATAPRRRRRRPNDPNGHDRHGALLHGHERQLRHGLLLPRRRGGERRTSDVKSTNSEIAYGMPTKFDRQVKLKVDRLYGPQYWENALGRSSPTPPDTDEHGRQLVVRSGTRSSSSNGTYAGFPGRRSRSCPGRTSSSPARSRRASARRRTARRRPSTTTDGADPGSGPGCPDDDDGDGDDDDDDGDSDDDGDDDDDDCEDDDDDEEDDDD